jgi:hypothetical protein
MKGSGPVAIVKSGRHPEAYRPDGAIYAATGTFRHKFRACQWAGRG